MAKLVGIIYCILFPNDKKYYGLTINLEQRKRQHKCAVNKGINNKLYNSIRKYGWDSIKWEIIEIHRSHNKKELGKLLGEREKYWINRDNTNLDEYGYNMTIGGDSVIGLKWSSKSRNKLSESQKGRKLSEEHKNNISNGSKGRKLSDEEKLKYKGINSGNTYCLGIKRSKETIKKMSDCKLGKNNPMFGKESSNKGKKMSEDQREKLRRAWERRKNKNIEYEK